jgi:hypothetical protein
MASTDVRLFCAIITSFEVLKGNVMFVEAWMVCTAC